MLAETCNQSATPDLSLPALKALTTDLAVHAEALDREARFPSENFDILAERGLVGLTVDKAYGGAGAGFVEGLYVLGAIAKGEPSTALILCTTFAFHAMSQGKPTWDPAVYGPVAASAAAGRGLIGVLREEPDLGVSAPGGLPRTVARRTGDGWALTGEKIHSTGSTGLDWLVVLARTDEPVPRLGSFLVDARSPAITIEPDWDHLGMRAAVRHRTVFAGTPVPEAHAVDVRPPEAWAPKPDDDPRSLIWNVLSIATIYDGVARAARDWLASYLNERVPANLGASLATLPRVQEQFGEIEALLHINRTLILSAAQRADAGELTSSVEVTLVKHIATSNAVRAVEIGLEITGSAGMSRNNPLERHYRDVLCSRNHSPASEAVLVGAGRAALARGRHRSAA